MNWNVRSILLLSVIALYGCHTESPVTVRKSDHASDALFASLSPSKTGLHFSNTLHEGLNTNILMYEYFYNGAGVATGDFNNDGFVDIYFSSNMEKNKLFLNNGSLTFNDVSATAGVEGREGPWKTGVTSVDINGDSRLDIYVCYSGTVKDENRANQLFINEGNDNEGVPQFTEQAEKFGLASRGYSNQGYFFDYDKDSDLDMLLLNHNPQSLPVLNEVSTKEILKQDDSLKGIRLYKNEDGHFNDITRQSGIVSSSLTYGLGAGVADINGDGWEDIYISNDYAVPDYLYINTGAGTFTDKLQQQMGHISHFSMGNDLADVNNDGALDIFTLDMLPEDNTRQKLLMAPDNFAKFEFNLRSGFYYQYMRNMLHLNNTNGTFSEIGQVAGISNTDWSWAALFADYNNDGLKDLFVTNGYLKDYTNLDFIKYMDDVVRSKGRLKRQDVLQMVSNMPSSNVTNYIFSNEDGIRFENRSAQWGMNEPSNSNGAAYADFDNDGDLDIVVNNINEPAFLFENKSKGNIFLDVVLKGEGRNTFGIGTKVTCYRNAGQQTQFQQNARGYLSSVSTTMHFGFTGAGKLDSLRVEWPSRKTQMLYDVELNRVLTLLEKDAAKHPRTKSKSLRTVLASIQPPLNYAHVAPAVNDFKRQAQLITQISYSGPVMLQGDVNGDGLEDVFTGGGNGNTSSIYIMQRDGKLKWKPVSSFEADDDFVDVSAAFLDVEKDGDLDLYVASGGYHNMEAHDRLLQDRLYLNNGHGDFKRIPDALPPMTGSKGCVAVEDINDDGLPDVFVGGRSIPGRFPEVPESYFLINKGDGKFENQISSIAPALQQSYRLTDAVWTDVDGDLRRDLVVTGEWMSPQIFLRNKGKLENATKRYFRDEFSGWWNDIHTADFNGDGRTDFIMGNHGLNSQYRASASQPIQLFYNDFDGNGSIDPILCSYVQGKSYPYLTRDEMLEQLGFLRSKFTNYKSYSTATLNDVLGPQRVRTAKTLNVNHLATTMFLSSSDGSYKAAQLPVEAQFSNVNAIASGDFDGDGIEDLVMCGNNSRMKLKIGKLDANYGLLLKGIGNGAFNSVPQAESGLTIKGDVGKILQVRNMLLFGIIGDKTVAYSFRSSSTKNGTGEQIAHVKP